MFRFHNVIVNLTLIIILCGVSKESYKSVCRLEQAKTDVERQMSSTKFIAESFRNACSGIGFSNLEEWQKKCKAMFELEYIGWAEASAFMKEEISEGKILVYGTWTGDLSSGEVFCREKRIQ